MDQALDPRRAIDIAAMRCRMIAAAKDVRDHGCRQLCRVGTCIEFIMPEIRLRAVHPVIPVSEALDAEDGSPAVRKRDDVRSDDIKAA
jgi:hypothetical protein